MVQSVSVCCTTVRTSSAHTDSQVCGDLPAGEMEDGEEKRFSGSRASQIGERIGAGRDPASTYSGERLNKIPGTDLRLPRAHTHACAHRLYTHTHRSGGG